MEGEKLITTNDYQDIENQLKESKKNVKRDLIISITIMVLVSIAAIIAYYFIFIKSGKTPDTPITPDKPDDDPLGDKSEIICTYLIPYSSNYTIINLEFSKPKDFDILIDNKKINFTNYYYFESEGEKEIKYIFYGDFSMDNMFKEIRELISINMTTKNKVKILSMKSAFESCNNLEKFNIH